MKPRVFVPAILAAGLMSTYSLALSRQTAGERETKERVHSMLETPPALQTEHERLHERLDKAIRSGGRTGEAAKKVQEKMRPHFEEEEKYAMPPLGLLRPLGEGEATPQMRAAIEMADRLEANYEKMLREHKEIVEALQGLSTAARAENKPEHSEFADTLILHAKTEEQVLYPATLLIGKYLKLQLGEKTE